MTINNWTKGSLLAIIALSFVFCQTQKEDIVLPAFEEKALWEKTTTYMWSLEKENAFDGETPNTALVALGKELFFEKKMSVNNTQSCNTCHNLNNYGVDNEVTSKGALGKRGTRNTPTILNANFQIAQMWDGRAKTIEDQAKLPIFTAHEMAMPDETTLVQKLKTSTNYPTLFNAAFPDQEQAISIDNIAQALGAFQRSIKTHSRFDAYINGDCNALTAQEKKGLNTFIDRGCSPCHSGATVGGNMYQRFALQGDYNDYTGRINEDNGRQAITNNPMDKNVFKVPSLRNIEKTWPYFHDGSVNTLEKAVEIMAKAQLNDELTQEEITDIVAFLKTLTADEIIF